MSSFGAKDDMAMCHPSDSGHYNTVCEVTRYLPFQDILDACFRAVLMEL